MTAPFTDKVRRAFFEHKDRHGLTYRQLGGAIGKSHTLIRDVVEEGHVPKEDVIVALADYFEWDRKELLFLARRQAASSAEIRQVYDSMWQDEIETKMTGTELPAGLAKVPVFDAQAGEPAAWTDGGYPVGYASQYEYLDADMVDGTSFCVTIHGDSMEPYLSEGDKVLVKPSDPLVNGKLCFASFAGETGSRIVKRYFRYGEMIVLRSDNPAYPEITLTPENGQDVRIYRVSRSIRQE